MTHQALILEEFGAAGGGLAAEFEQARNDAYAEGFAAGKASAAEQAAIDAGIVEAVERALQASDESLRAQANLELGRALHSVLSQIMPALANKGFAQETANIVRDLNNTHAAPKIELRTSAEQFSRVANALEQAGLQERASAAEDPVLSGAVAIAEWEDGGIEINLDDAVKQILSALDGYVGAEERE
ncbi:MAG: hypothetical protein AAGC77_05265 [Pseudomonadota bacterium]